MSQEKYKIERVDCVAMQHATTGQVWHLLRPARHGELIHYVYNQVGERVGSMFKQGFLTTTGRFVSRQEAFRIAKQAGQISKDDVGKTLISEDVW